LLEKDEQLGPQKNGFWFLYSIFTSFYTKEIGCFFDFISFGIIAEFVFSENNPVFGKKYNDFIFFSG